MRLALLYTILLLPMISFGQSIPERLDQTRVRVMRGGSPGFNSTWRCDVGVNNSRQHLPREAAVRVTVDRMGRVGFHPDIFRTNDNVGNLLNSVFKRRLKPALAGSEYRECVANFLTQAARDLTQYRERNCQRVPSPDPLCRLTSEHINSKVDAEVRKSRYLRNQIAAAPPRRPDDNREQRPVPPRPPEGDGQTDPIPDDSRGDGGNADRPQPDPEPEAPAQGAQGRRFMAFMGGGGEPAGATTIFDREVRYVGNFVRRAPAWQTTVSFDGGHSTTEQLVRSNFGAAATNFTAQTFEDIVARYERQIQNGEITSGDQLMLMINSHGSTTTDQVQTHFIAVTGGTATDLNTLQGARTVSLDRLRRLTQLAEQRGIKLALVDLSCHSGVTQALANSRTCVISSTGPTILGYGANDNVFSARFTDNLRPGRNLEEVFLLARNSTGENSFPMISTPAGRAVQDQLYPLIYRYQTYDHGQTRNRSFTENLERAFTSGSCDAEPAGFQQLLTLVRETEQATNQNFSALRNSLQEYSDFRTGIFDEMRAMGAESARQNRQFCANYRDRNNRQYVQCMNYTGLQALSMDIDASAQYFNNRGEPSDAAFVAILNQVRTWRQQLLAQHPRLTEYQSFIQNYPRREQRTMQLAGRVSQEARRLYSTLYSQQPNTSSNPCRDFVL